MADITFYYRQLMRYDPKIGRRLKLRELHTLAAVAERKSMAKAAVELGLTQPAVTRTIADMEQTLGVRLFDRNSRGVEPTVYGQALLKWCGVVFDNVRQAITEVESLSDPTAGELRIGAVAPMLQGLLPAILDRLSCQHSRIAFDILPGRSAAEQYRDLRERNIDLIIGRLVRVGKDDDLERQILFHEPIHVVAGTTSRWAGRRNIKLAELANEAWILPRPSTGPETAWHWVVRAFERSKLEIPRTRISTNSVPLQVAMLSTGRYLAMLPRSLVSFAGKRLDLSILRVKLPVHPPPVGIVTLKNRTVSPVTGLFIACAREVSKSLAKMP